MAGQALDLVILNGFFILLAGVLLVLVVLIVGLCPRCLTRDTGPFEPEIEEVIGARSRAVMVTGRPDDDHLGLSWRRGDVMRRPGE